MSGAPRRVRATFWLSEAPDSLEVQSRREPDGTGLGWFAEDGEPCVDKQPIAAFEDAAFAREAREVESRTFVAHVRLASNGGLEVRNTHPFLQAGRLFAHNGVLGDLPALEARLGPMADLVQGDTDSERFFALITREIAERDGDVAGGIAAAAGWAARELPVLSLNLVLATSHELWALRYPETDTLFVLEREPGGHHGARRLEATSQAGTRVRSAALAQSRSAIVASERLDEHPAWRELAPGELVHVDDEGRLSSLIVLDTPPRHRLTLA